MRDQVVHGLSAPQVTTGGVCDGTQRGPSHTPKHRGREIGRQTPYLVMVKATTNGGGQLASSSCSHRGHRANVGQCKKAADLDRTQGHDITA